MKKLFRKILKPIEDQLDKLWVIVMDWTYERSEGSKFTDPYINVAVDLDVLKDEVIHKIRNKIFEYIPDRWFGMSNHIKEPKHVKMHMYGDCDDWASYIMGRAIHYPAYIFTYFRWNFFKAHTVAIVYNEDTYRWRLFDWADVKEFDTFELLCKYLEKKYKMRIISRHIAKYDWHNARYNKVEQGNLPWL